MLLKSQGILRGRLVTIFAVSLSRGRVRRMTRRVPILETPVNSSETSGLRRAYISKGLEVNRYVSRGTIRGDFRGSFSLEESAPGAEKFLSKIKRGK